jgi:hypothetical protein
MFKHTERWIDVLFEHTCELIVKDIQLALCELKILANVFRSLAQYSSSLTDFKYSKFNSAYVVAHFVVNSCWVVNI